MEDRSYELTACASRADYFTLFESQRFAIRWQVERRLAETHRAAATFALPGICDVCARAVDFSGDFAHAWPSPEGLLIPNWRECLRCPSCRLNGRQRWMVRLLADAIDGRPSGPFTVYLMEMVSPVYERLRATFADVDLVGSEFLGADERPGSIVRGLRHEDAEHLSFANDAIDLFVSCDVYEHVNDPDRAFREAHRVLKPGGRALLTFPMDPSLEGNRRRATIEGGKLRILEPEVFHGNPLSKKGALVFTDFGWEVLDQLRAAGFAQPLLHVYWSYELGYLGVQYYFDATKAS